MDIRLRRRRRRQRLAKLLSAEVVFLGGLTYLLGSLRNFKEFRREEGFADCGSGFVDIAGGKEEKNEAGGLI